MEVNETRKKFYATALVLLLLLAMLSTATYAWFSSNFLVQTNIIDASTDSSSIELLLQDTHTGKFTEGPIDLSDTFISGLNTLQPVTSADGKWFLAPRGQSLTEEDLTKVQLTTENTLQDIKVDFFGHLENVAHGTITMVVQDETFDIRKVATSEEELYRNLPWLLSHEGENKVVDIYLDESKTPIFSNIGDDLRDCIRLSIKVNDEDSQIFKLTPDALGNLGNNTYIYGYEGQAGTVVKVLDDEIYDEDGNLKQNLLDFVIDPAELLGEHTIQNGVLPSKPIATIPMNHLAVLYYAVYLEGCDLDCTDDAWAETFDFTLSFHGVVREVD